MILEIEGGSLVGPSRINRLFLHYFDMHFLAEKGRATGTSSFYDELRRATRMAVASADVVFIPAASYFESPLCRQVVDELAELKEAGIITITGSSITLDEFVNEHLDTSYYRQGSHQYDAYKSELHKHIQLPYIRRQRGATRDIISAWNHRTSTDELAILLRDAAGKPLPEVERRLPMVPERLQGLAFVPDHVYEVLDAQQTVVPVRSRIRDVINRAYIDSYVQDLAAGVVVDLVQLASSFEVPSCGRNLSYRQMMRYLMRVGRVRELDDCSPAHLLQMGEEAEWRVALRAATTYVGVEQRIIQGAEPSMSVLCVAVASAEFKSIRVTLEQCFNNGSSGQIGNHGDHFSLNFRDPESGAEWRLVQLAFQGETEAAAAIAKFCAKWNPSVVLMVGMCMGMPKRKLEVGTVVIPNEVFAFDHQRHVAHGATQYRPHAERVDTSLYGLARLLASASELEYRVIADKGLASASVKIENIDSSLVRFIEESYPDATAFDMEGAGFYNGARGKNCLWIKAVADGGEPQGESQADKKAKQAIQSDVTRNATDFAIRLIREFARSK